ncbi:tyrosine-type recombinase/integrase [Escherichia coli]|uniref:tyrosine-type recombinase/integrase n=2 Tax=Escherichia coli TaxID=562 RepID=UPI000985D54D|nr:site-specific integrase [Escherichia coli]EFK2283430.1 tyrosine-type recombinase/integrase [Escherichia coli]EFK2337201.1 tyrosine-type recombinase/integrase [Escherichia coli]EFK3121222.1 tyrosine-type recombinase/integrase [Escherichia coli]EJQ0262596.1 tyrosine-type recombinase/integrase [Escherichia coli]MDC3514184.1 tyrosine-type recombinase/integrase [Escherichia coli]
MLTDTRLRTIANKPYDGPSEIADRDGLSARISPKGKITFQYRYRFNGKPVRMKIGEYGKMSLKDARYAVSEYRELLTKGKNPALCVKQAIAFEQGKRSISDVVEDYLSLPNVIKLVAYKEVKSALMRHVVNKYGDYIADDVTTKQWMDIFGEITAAGHAVTAGLILKRMKIIVNSAIRRGLMTNTAINNIRVADVGEHYAVGERYLSCEEIGHFWRTVDSSQIYPQNKIALKLLLLTGCRVGELQKMRREHLDLDNGVWTVPAAVAKTRSEIRRGLSDLSIKMLREVLTSHEYDYVFPPVINGGNRPVNVSVIKVAAIFVRKRMGGKSWSCHDLRRTCRTHLSAIGVPVHIAEKILGHSLRGILAVYDKYDYLDEQKEALNKFADYVLSLADVKPIRSKNCITS